MKYYKKHYGTLYAYMARFEMLCTIMIRLVLWAFVTLIDCLTLKGANRRRNKIRYYWYALLWHFSKPHKNSINIPAVKQVP
jgi:hypothetical protein